MPTLRRALASAADVLIPPLCRACDEVADGTSWGPLLCARCEAGFPVLDTPVGAGDCLAAAHAFADFSGAARRLLLDLKYGGVVRAGCAIGAGMAVAPGGRALLDRCDAIVPVPLHWGRRWRRGHNQARVLARAVSHTRPGPPLVDALCRVRATRPQVGLSRRARSANLAAAFRLRRSARGLIAGSKVVLIDDVVTTGATAAAAAAALHAAGVAEVRLYAASVARL